MPRDASHFDALLRLLELERAEESARLAGLRESLPLAELEARGLVLLDVECEDESVGLGGRPLASFARPDRRPLAATLSPGDLVRVAPRKAEVEDAPTGTVTRATRSSLQVAFEAPPPEWLAEGRLRIDLVGSDVTFSRAREGLGRLKALDRGRSGERRDVLLGAAPARFERPPDFEASRPLNPEQREAVTLSLSARDFALVHGPPGTGKSSVLAEVAVQLARQGRRLLAAAASNAAVDHLLELCLAAGLRAVRVGHPARVLPHLQAHTLDLAVEEHPDRKLARELFDEAFDLLGYARRQRSRGRSRERFANAREASAEARRLMGEARELERRAVAALLDSAQVVCATLAMLGSPLLAPRRFDVALLDEATQAIEPLSLLAFLKAEVLILAGDPQQLPPTVLSQEAGRGGLGVSLFERLLADHGAPVVRMLEEQHRMHEALMGFPSREIYAGRLRAHPEIATRSLAEVLAPGAEVDAPPLLFLDTAGRGFEETPAPGTESLRNEGEAELVAARARALLAAGLAPRELAVITPYRAQAALLRERLADLPELEVDSVDAFQGREKDAVLVSLVRSNAERRLGFLEDLRRMNVALTRARRHLFVVGDSATLAAHDFYARLIEHAHALGGWRSVWEWKT
jgi:superfamily I DNA and/or RNA helicase